MRHQNKVCTYVLYSSQCDIIFATIITVRTSTRGPSMNNWLMPINSNFSKTFYKYILPIKMLMQISIYLILVWYFLISRIPNFRLDTPCTDICFQFWQKLFFAHITLIDQWTQKILSCFDFYTRNCSKHRKLLDCWT